MKPKMQLLNNSQSAESVPTDPGQVDAESLVKRWRFSPTDLTKHRQQTLLQLARAAIVSYLQAGCIPNYNTDDPILRRRAGAFVTLWRLSQPTGLGLPAKIAGNPKTSSEEEGQLTHETTLRGCIGHVHADTPLFRIVQEMAVAAATADPRMSPVSLDELDEIRIEISVLSPLRPVTDLRQIQIGANGLMIVDGLRRGLLLPEVPLRLNWSREEFLTNLCRKAGLLSECWPGTAALYAFTTVKFGEARA